MGELIKFSCVCGYEKELLVGQGLMAKNKDYIRQEFSKEELLEFEKAIIKGVDDYRLRQHIAYCAGCEEIVNITILRYNKGRQTTIIAKPCLKCGTDINFSDAAVDCPKCGKKLKEELAGLWD